MPEKLHLRDAVVVTVCMLALVAAVPAAAQGATVTCESTQGERAFCSADTSHGVTLQRQLGDAPCKGNWGSDENGVWVTNRCRAEFLLGKAGDQGAADTSVVGGFIDMMTGGQGASTQSAVGLVVCESKDNMRVLCPVDTRGGVELQRQLSSAPCAGAWGQTPEGIWVDKGCRAEFMVYPVQVATPAPGQEQILVCESRDNRRVTCPVDTQGRVELRRQLSSAPCAGAWGQTPEGIWVDKGCRAEFRVYPVQARTPIPRSEQMLACESKDGQRAFCSADTRGGVELRRELGRVPCVGRWGYDGDGVWVDDGCRAEFTLQPVEAVAVRPEGTIVCSSKKNRRAFCSADTRNGVTLQRQLGDATCIGNWGYDADGIWVDNGCRGEFRTTSYKTTSTTLPGSGSVVTCESNSGERNYCRANIGSGVKLQRQLSTAPCVGHWGYDAGGIWVEKGCRAEFSIR